MSEAKIIPMPVKKMNQETKDELWKKAAEWEDVEKIALRGAEYAHRQRAIILGMLGMELADVPSPYENFKRED
jgi:hypothetical protein